MFLICPSGNAKSALEWVELRREAWVGYMNVGVLDKGMIFLSPWSRCSCLGQVGRGCGRVGRE